MIDVLNANGLRRLWPSPSWDRQHDRKSMMARGSYALICAAGFALGCSVVISDKPNESRDFRTAAHHRAKVARGTLRGSSVEVTGVGDGSMKRIEGADSLVIR
jgi:hypothetical protein